MSVAGNGKEDAKRPDVRGANLYGANLRGAVGKSCAIGLPDDLKGDA